MVSLVVKLGALVFILALPQQYAIQLQLLGGVWIIQTLPAVMLGLYTRWLEPKALLLGWAAGIASGTWMAAALNFKGSIYPLTIAGFTMPGYAAFYSVHRQSRRRPRADDGVPRHRRRRERGSRRWRKIISKIIPRTGAPAVPSRRFRWRTGRRLAAVLCAARPRGGMSRW